MRVISGIYKGRRLISPPDDTVRPTADRVKEAVFSMLQSKIPGSVILDLFTGSGALAIEAVSRGAKMAVCVDKDTSTVIKNTELIKCNNIEIIKADYITTIKKLESRQISFDIIFIDPPYRLHYEEILDFVTGSNICSKDTVIVTEHAYNKPVSAPIGYKIVNTKKYSITAITIIEKEIER